MRIHKPPHVQVKKIETSESGDACPFCGYSDALISYSVQIRVV
jgi:hypothetical protein